MLLRILFNSVAILRTLYQKSPSLVSFWVSPNKLLNFPESIFSPVKQQRYLHLTAEEQNGAQKHFVLRETQLHTPRSRRNASSPWLVCRQEGHSAEPPGPWLHAQRERDYALSLLIPALMSQAKDRLARAMWSWENSQEESPHKPWSAGHSSQCCLGTDEEL